MKRFLTVCVAVVAMSCGAAYAGGLRLEVGNPEANAEAKSLNALLVARVTACQEPAKSRVTASIVQLVNGHEQRTRLNVVQLAKGDAFAVTGSMPGNGTAVIELAVTNPEYKNYEPRVLIRRDAAGIQWGSLKHFFSTPPTAADIKAVLE